MLTLESHTLDHLRDHRLEINQRHPLPLKIIDCLDLVRNLVAGEVLRNRHPNRHPNHLPNLLHLNKMEKLYKVNRNHHVQYVQQNHDRDQGVHLLRSLGKVLIHHHGKIHDLDPDRLQLSGVTHHLDLLHLLFVLNHVPDHILGPLLVLQKWLPDLVLNQVRENLLQLNLVPIQKVLIGNLTVGPVLLPSTKRVLVLCHDRHLHLHLALKLLDLVHDRNLLQ